MSAPGTLGNITTAANTAYGLLPPGDYGHVRLGSGAKQTLSGGTTAADIVYLVHSGMTVYSQTFGYNTRLYGTICAPQAPIKIGNGAEFEGAVYADSISVGYNVCMANSSFG